MPVTSISYQPNVDQLLAVYRPIRFIVVASTTSGKPVPPYVSCDIYIGGVYFKSILRTVPVSFTDIDSNFEFDIANALQEYFQPNIAVINNRNILQAPHMGGQVYCKFRASDIDADGFTIEEPDIPVQGTKFTDPVAGTGFVSNSFYAINASLQHEDNQNLASHLNHYKQGGWHGNAYPLTHRNRYFFCPGDSDHFPVIFKGDCTSGSLVMRYKRKGSLVYETAVAVDHNVCDPIGFNVVVTLSKIEINLIDELPDGHYVLVQYKKSSNPVWTDAGKFNAQNIVFLIPPLLENIGDFDVRVVHFCSSCQSAPPIVKTFTVGGVQINYEWRGTGEYCIRQEFDQPVYITLELRNLEVENSYFPSTEFIQKLTVDTMADLYVKFFSDKDLLNPLDLDYADLILTIKRAESRADFSEGYTNSTQTEVIDTYTINAGGTEAFLGRVNTQKQFANYNPHPTIVSSTNITYAYSPYPDYKLEGGNTGLMGYTTLRLYNADYNTPILSTPTKPNDPEDPDYKAPQLSPICAGSADVTTITYGQDLEVSKVEFRYNGGFIYAETVSNTGAGGQQFTLALPKNTMMNIAVKARNRNVLTVPGVINTTKVYVSVTYISSTGQNITRRYAIANNVETPIPATFQNIVNVGISIN